MSKAAAFDAAALSLYICLILFLAAVIMNLVA
jgi:hypothetical protein